MNYWFPVSQYEPSETVIQIDYIWHQHLNTDVIGIVWWLPLLGYLYLYFDMKIVHYLIVQLQVALGADLQLMVIPVGKG